MISKLDQFYTVYIQASLDRLYQTQSYVSIFNFSVADLSRTRVTPDLIDVVVGYFSRKNVSCIYNDVYKDFEITIDLRTCSLNPVQSQVYSDMFNTLIREGYLLNT